MSDLQAFPSLKLVSCTKNCWRSSGKGVSFSQDQWCLWGKGRDPCSWAAVLTLCFTVCILMLQHWGLTDPVPPRDRQLPGKDGKEVGWEHTFHIQSNQSIACPTLSDCHTWAIIHLSCLSSQSQAPAKRGQTVCPMVCWDDSNQPILNPLTLPHQFLPMVTAIKALAPIFSPLTDPSAPLGVPPLWCGCPLLSGMVSNRLSFQWLSSSGLLTSPDPNNNKTYILKLQHLWWTVAQRTILKKNSLCCGLKRWSPAFEVF